MNDPNNSSNNSVWSWGLSGDKPFIGNFLDESGSVSGNKDEIAIYRPSTKTFWILNPRSSGSVAFSTTADSDSDPFSNCGTRSTSMVWGSNNGSYADDIPLTINAGDAPMLRRPTAYRITKGAYDHSLSDGQWWVHDRF